ncbi:hypothetical protein Ade02nite_29820 [Paractinoplanes deccanensis]|uniref:DUF916 domain-containing protein n=1 Tax=Paractinoplanes deccanensis TaxID=113561 RepID=A0ABQ3Y2X2_9ACTN|nr:DUF916 domain-containing protein [Actinoplanes deccanensis]GID74341.1 hypothetical protein Ade02nite_29820 [Actinoplanes deccanensis]
MHTRIAAAVLALLLVPAPANAAPGNDPLTWSVSPSGPQGPNGRPALDYKLDPGATLTDHVAVTNHSARPLTLRLYASDAFTTAGGGFDLLAGTTKPTGAGSWIRLGRTTVTLPKSSRVIVPLTLTVPANATPGDHAAGVVASLTSGTGESFTVDHRVGTRVYLRVTGPVRPALSITDVHLTTSTPWNPLALPRLTATFTIANTGNVRLSARPSARAAGPFGIGATTAAGAPVAEILPGGSVRTSVRLDSVPPLFRSQVTLAASPSTGAARRTVWLVPWPQLALLALAAALVAGRLLNRRRRRIRLAAAIAEAEQRGRDQAAAPDRRGSDHVLDKEGSS